MTCFEQVFIFAAEVSFFEQLHSVAKHTGEWSTSLPGAKKSQ